jgi:hypothetical protein
MSRLSFSSRGVLDVASANLDSKKVYELTITPPVPASAKITSIVARCLEPLGNHVQPAFAMNGTLHLIKVVDPHRQKALKKDQTISLNVALPRREYMTLTVMNKVPQGNLVNGKLEIIYSYVFPFAAGAKAHTPVATVADVARSQVRDASLKRGHQVTPTFISMSPNVMVAAEKAAQEAVKQSRKPGLRK